MCNEKYFETANILNLQNDELYKLRNLFVIATKFYVHLTDIMGEKLNKRLTNLENELEYIVNMHIQPSEAFANPMMIHPFVGSALVTPDYIPKDPTSLALHPGFDFSANYLQNSPHNCSPRFLSCNKNLNFLDEQQVQILSSRSTPSRCMSRNSFFSNSKYETEASERLKTELEIHQNLGHYQHGEKLDISSKGGADSLLFLKFPDQHKKLVEYKDASVQIENGDEFVPKTQIEEEIRKREEAETLAKKLQGEVQKMITDTEQLYKTKSDLESELSKCKDAEKTATFLRVEVEKIQSETIQLAKHKSEACEMSKKLKERYEHLRTSRKELTAKIGLMQKENAKLCQEIKDEIKLRNTAVENAVSQTMKDMRMQIEQECKDESDRLKTEMLNGLKIREHEFEEREKVAEETVRKLEEALKRLTDTNEQFANKLKSSNEEFKNEHEEVERLKSQISLFRTTTDKYQKDIEQLQLKLKEAKHEDVHIQRENRRLNEKLSDSRNRERECREQVASLTKELQEIEAIKAKLLENENGELEELKTEYANLLEDNKCLQTKLQNTENDNQNRFKILETEVTKFTQTIAEKENNMLKEMERLKTLVQELTQINKRQKNKISDLIQVCMEKENTIQSQLAVIDTKDEQLKVQLAETKEAIRKCEQMGRQEEKIKYIIEACGDRTRTEKIKNEDKLQEKISDLKEAVELEKDRVLLKEKVISDQLKTIQDLKERTLKQREELRTRDSQIASSEKEKDILRKDMEASERKKQQLKAQIEDLEESLQLSNKQQQQIGKHHAILVSLEQQVSAQKKRWAQQKDMLIKEKAQATKAARFATHKLLETVSDFQKQMESQKRAQVMLANLLKEKEHQLAKANNRICLLHSDLEEISVSEELMRDQFQKTIRTVRETCSELMGEVVHQNQQAVSNVSSMFERPKPLY